MRAFRIYFGRGRSDGGTISSAEVRRFINTTVRPRFEAFTIQAGRGYWRRNSEPSLILEIIRHSRGGRQAVRQIAAEYKRQFGQDAVLVVGNDVDSALL